ncbi:exostosin-like 2 isoform X1 [Corythoichthys intestinalis]|uniref:exostosin-like 2 isoform X1 n=1 Tax=Corythoichthys intestinalis TaxID=161448 RepID=UPI0025A518AB|nr:exostosin-like 2 isoform X1 [Corythoichthys intestinalis]
MFNPAEEKFYTPCLNFRGCNCRVGRNRACLFFWSSLVLLVVVVTLKALQYQQGDVTEIPRELTDFKQEGFTLIIQTYKRDDILLKVLERCLAVPQLQKIIIVWNNVEERPTQKLRESLAHHSTAIVFLEQKINSMQNRLQPFSEIHTDAVLMLDDDILLSASDISFAFTIWKLYPDQIVGFVPRKHVETSPGVYNYDGIGLPDSKKVGGDKYSMVLISAAFFHCRYLQLYKDQPKALHSLVDDTHNCDDIAMNFVVALHLHKVWAGARPAGVFVKPVDMVNLEKQADSGFKGLWQRPEHFKQRSYCLNQLTKIYGFMPLQFSDIMVMRFRKS